MTIVFDSNIAEIEAKFDKWTKKFRNKDETILKPFLEKEVKRTKKRIRTDKRTPDGIPWAIWAESTAISRARKGTALRGLLYDTGALLKSIEYDINNDRFAVGSGVDYAEYLQEGTDNMPAREFLGFNERSEADILWLTKTIFRT